MPETTPPPRTPCIGHEQLFLAPEGERSGSEAAHIRIRAAKNLCWSCPAVYSCREEGRRLGAEGVWGGEDDRQRRAAGYQAAPVPTATLGKKPADCGTESGAKRHRRLGEITCEPCREPCREASAEATRRRKEARAVERPANMPHRGAQILQFLDNGMTPIEIAHHLRLSKATIYGHIQRICAALGVPSHLIVATARARGILPAAAAPVDADREQVAA